VAGAADSNKVFLGFGGSSGKMEKRGEGGVDQAFIGELDVGRGLGLGLD
jgi:hypothetical protein